MKMEAVDHGLELNRRERMNRGNGTISEVADASHQVRSAFGAQAIGSEARPVRMNLASPRQILIVVGVVRAGCWVLGRQCAARRHGAARRLR